MQACGQVARDFFEQAKVVRMIGAVESQVVTFEVETCAQGMFAHARRGDITRGAHHAAQCRALRGGRYSADLPANAFGRQLGAVGEALDLGGAGQYHHGGTGQ
ncbi:hypothetical protein FQZ97_761090 [compost metagenome]